MTRPALTNEQAVEAYELSKAGWSERQLAYKYGCGSASIGRTLRRLRNDVAAGRGLPESASEASGQASARAKATERLEAIAGQRPEDPDSDEAIEWELALARIQLEDESLPANGRAALMAQARQHRAELRRRREPAGDNNEHESAAERVTAKLRQMEAAMNSDRGLVLVEPKEETDAQATD